MEPNKQIDLTSARSLLNFQLEYTVSSSFSECAAAWFCLSCSRSGRAGSALGEPRAGPPLLAHLRKKAWTGGVREENRLKVYQRSSHAASHFDPQSMQGRHEYPYFLGEETEAQKFSNY